MNTTDTLGIEQEQQLNAILLGFLQAEEQGQAPDREQFLAAHPQFADPLREFFAGRDYLQRLNVRGAESSPQASAVGTLGDFELLREVGRGGMGIVYQARQISLERWVAVKVLPFAAALDQRQLQRFQNEAHAAALLNHPNIVPIYSVGCEQGTHFYAMKFIEGQSLAALIDGLRHPKEQKVSLHSTTQTMSPHRSSLSPTALAVESSTSEGGQGAPSKSASARAAWKPAYFRRVTQLGATAAEALEHAHQMGVIHRDIKPANLLLDRQGNLWITDFGVALLQNKAGLTVTGELVGTLRYMSPEQTGTRPGLVDHRTDVYSLGATLYELLTLQPPFGGEEPRQLSHQIATEDPASLRSLDSAIPLELDLIVRKALRKNPAERYATARELADDLQRFLNDQPIQARPPSLTDRTVKWARRHRTAVLSALAVLPLATATLLVSTILIARSNMEAQTALQRERQKAEEARQERARAESSLEQARQLLAYLTRVSAEELGDRPELLATRQKMLEATLRYYQQFIDRHADDPSTQAELNASKSHVSQILAALSAQREYLQLMLRTMLLDEQAVQRDIGVTPQQERKLAQLSERLTEQRQEVFHMSLTLSERERGEKFKAMAADNEQAMSEILTPQQMKRLEQIALQARGIGALAELELADALRLTSHQKARIRDLLDEAQRTQGMAFRSGTRPGEFDEEISRVMRNVEQTILALLTPEQQAAWGDMIGPAFQGRIHFSPQSSPPDLGRPGGRKSGPGHGPPPDGDWGPGRGPSRMNDGPPGSRPGPPGGPPSGPGRGPDGGPPRGGPGHPPGRR